MGPIRLVSITLVITIVFLGVPTVPHLMFEEKRTKTLDALVVSPAIVSQIVLGTAVTALFYCLLGAAVVFALNRAHMVMATAGLALALVTWKVRRLDR